ncbi:unnamed protein product [Toxocara canis]|uniref:Msx2-interacting protein n=1 Tax=Toxocara canis TaxID=6265 RepID=A0A183UCJ2_TOXCA|nr:unnamed protein product [Toxocara canis]
MSAVLEMQAGSSTSTGELADRKRASHNRGASSHHHHSSNAPTVASTVVKLSTSSSRRIDILESSTVPHDSANASVNSSCAQPPPTQGMQGVYVSNLPSSRSESSLREFLSNSFKKFGKIVHIGFEMEVGPNFVEQRKALIIFQRLNEVDRLLNDVHHLLGLRLKIKLASHMLVTETYNNLLAMTSAQASALPTANMSTSSHDTPSTYSRSFLKDERRTGLQDCSQEGSSASLHCSPCVDALAPRASRTLYVGGLERRTSDDSLRARFAHFGHILDIDVKNWESPSPFAFIQFADIQSVVRAINAYNGSSSSGSHACANKGKFKTNWGRTIVTNKIWIGDLPSSCSSDYVREKIRVSFTETFNEVIYDPRWNEALLLFATNDSAQRAFTMIKTKQIAFWDGDEKRDVHVPVDYCSEKLHDYFVDRKFRGDKESAASDLNGASAFGGSSATTAVASTSSLLAPPPDPPSHLRDMPRLDYRRSGSNSISKRRRSVERDAGRNSSRSSRYSCAYNRSRRRRERARHEDDQSASTSTSTSSTSESDSSDSRATSPERKRDGTTTNRSRSSQRNTNHPSTSRKPREQSTSSSSARRGSSTPTMRVEPPGTSGAASGGGGGGGGSQLAQLLPPPMPSAAILNPLTASCEKPTTVDDNADSKNKRTALKRQHSFSSSSVDMDADVVERRKDNICDLGNADNRNSRDSGFCESSHDNISTSETHIITSNRIEEIANTLVNVLQHHSKASTSAVPIDPLTHGTSQRASTLHASNITQQRISEDSKSAAPWQSTHSASATANATGLLGAQKRAKWPWGSEPIKSHHTIPLDAYNQSTLRDPRRRPSLGISSPTFMNLPLPKFAHDVSFASVGSRRNSLSADASRTAQPHTETRRPSRGNVNGHSSGCTPPHSSTTLRTHPSVSRSASSGSEAMLSPDPTTTNTQHPALPMSGMDIFGEGSPSNDSNAALRERIFALGAKFQHVDETFQKTKRTSQFDYERKPSTQRTYKFEEELERLRSKSSTGCSPSTPVTSLASTSSVLTSNTASFTESFLKTRSYSVPHSSATDSVDDAAAAAQNAAKPLLSVTLHSACTTTAVGGQGSATAAANVPTSTVAQTSTTTAQTPITAVSSGSLSATISPPFASGPLKKPPMPPSPAILKQQTSLAAAQMPPHVVAFPPNFSVPPPPIPQPPAPPTLLSSALPTNALISAPPPPPPMMLNPSVHRDPMTPSTQQTTQSLAVQPKGAGISGMSVSNVSAASSFPSTPTWKSAAVSSTKSTTPLSLSSSSLPSEALVKSTVTTPKTSLNRPVDKLANRETFQRSSSLASGSKHSHGDRSKHNDSSSKSLSDLFRQQAQDSSEMRRKQMLKTKMDETNEPKQEKDKDGDNSRKACNEGSSERSLAKEAEKKEKSVREVKEKKKGWDGTEGKVKNESHHAKESNEKKEKEKERESKDQKGKDISKEKKSSKEDKEKERSRVREKAKEKAAKAKKEEERKRREQKEKERKRKEKAKEKKRRKNAKNSDEVSDSKESESSSSDEQVNIHSFDIEMQRLMLEEAASGSLGLSMYDRVKRRSSAMKPDDTAKKNKTLEILREKTQNKRNSQRRVKRVQLDSSSDDNDEDNHHADEDSDAISSVSSGALQRSSKGSKVATSNRKTTKVTKTSRKQAHSEDSETDDEIRDGCDKSSDESDSDEDVIESKRRKRKPVTSKKTVKRAQTKSKAHSLSLDDVFGAYSTDDESTQQSRGSMAPSVDSKVDKKEKARERVKEKDKMKEKEAEKEREEREKVKERAEKQKEKEREKAKEKEKEEKETERTDEVEKEKEKEKKSEPKKRPKKNLSTLELFGRDSDVEIPSERKKQKVEKSLVEISMFPEMNKKEGKQKKKESGRKGSELKKTKEGKEAVVSKNEQFEKKLAKRLRKEQKEREEEQKREADESKKKEEEGRNEKDAEKLNEPAGKGKDSTKAEESREEEESPHKTDVEDSKRDHEQSAKKDSLNEEMVKGDLQEEVKVEEEHGVDKEQLTEEKKRDEIVDGKITDVDIQLREEPNERKRKATESEGVFEVKRVKEEAEEQLSRKQLSDSESSAGETKQKGARRQKTAKRRAPRKRVNNDEKAINSEARSDSSTTAAVKSEFSEESERVATPSDTGLKSCMLDEPASEKFSLLEDVSKWSAESTKSVTDDDESASVCAARVMSKGAMKAPPEPEQSAAVSSQSPHATTKDGSQSITSDEEHDVAISPAARERSVSSSSSSTTGSGSSRTTSSTTAEPEVEPEAEASAGSRDTTVEPADLPAPELDTKSSMNETELLDSQPELGPDLMQQQPKSDAEHSPENKTRLPSLRSDEMITFVASSDAECSAVSMVSGQLGGVPSSDFDPENGDSNGGFELIDSGRVDDLMNDEDEMAAVPPERDVHDVQETEDAVQSIALFDDNASRHSGEEGSAAMDINYMSDTTSRRSSIADTTAMVAQDSQGMQREFANEVDEDQEDKEGEAEGDPEQEMETETKVADEANNDDEKLCDSVTHIDEVIDDVVAGGYMEVDAEQLMLINSKAKEEADRAAAFASQQNTPQTPHSSHSFQADSSHTSASARSVEHQHQMSVSSCMMQSQMMQQQQQQSQTQTQTQPQLQQQSQLQQQQPHSQQQPRAATVASPYHQIQQPLSMQHAHPRHEIIHQQQAVPVNGSSDMHDVVGVRLQQQNVQQQQPLQQSPLQQQQPAQQQQQVQQSDIQQMHQKTVSQQTSVQQQMMQQHTPLQSSTMQQLMQQRQSMQQQQQPSLPHQMAVHVQPQQQQQMHQLQQQQKLFVDQHPMEQPVQANTSVALQQQQPNEVQCASVVGYSRTSDYFASVTGTQQSESMQSPTTASRAMQQPSVGAQQQHQLGYGNLPAATAAPTAHMQMQQQAVSTGQRPNQQPASAYDIYRQPPSAKQQQPSVAQQQQPSDPSRQSVSHIGGTNSSPSMLTHLSSNAAPIPQLGSGVAQQQANAATYRRQQASPMQQAAIAASATLSPFAMALPATSSSTYFQTAQMQEQYMQMCRNTLLQQGGASSSTQQPQDAAAAQVMRNYAHIFQAATNAYGSGMSGTYGAPPHAAYPTSASLVNGGTSTSASPLTTGIQHDRVRQQQTQHTSCAISTQQQHQQANIAAVAQQQLNSLYNNGGLAFGYGAPTVQQHNSRQTQQVTQQGAVSLGGVHQRQQQVKVSNTTAKKQQIKGFPQPPSVASSSTLMCGHDEMCFGYEFDPFTGS